MTMDPTSITLLAIAATMVVGFGGIVVTIHSTANATNRRVDDFRADVDRRFEDLKEGVDRRLGDFRTEVGLRLEETNKQLADLRVDFREMRGRVDYIADSLSLGRVRVKKRA